MQLAGSHCGACTGKVTLDSDATWCARCQTVIHKTCLEGSGNTCPQCKTAYEPPSSRFVYSAVCPVCEAANPGSAARCARCKASTRWDTRAAYDRFRAHLQRSASSRTFRGYGALAAAVACATVFAIIVTSGPPRLFIGFLLAGSVVLVIHGLSTLAIARRLRRFR